MPGCSEARQPPAALPSAGTAPDHLYARAQFADLTPLPLTPLIRSGGLGAELRPAWERALRRCGLSAGPAAGSAVVLRGGYPYLNVSLLRLLGQEAVGADEAELSGLVLGDRADIPRMRDKFDGLSVDHARLDVWTESVRLGPTNAYLERMHEAVRKCRSERPALAECTDTGLVARVRAVRPLLAPLLELHAQTELAAAVTTIMALRGDDDTRVVAATGTNLPGDDDLLAELDQVNHALVGCDRLAEHVEDGPDATAEALNSAPRRGELGILLNRLDALRQQWGHLGEQTWGGPAGETWETSSAPVLRVCAALRTRPAGTALLAGAGGPAERAARWLRTRRAVLDLIARCHHEQHMAARELGGRWHARGLLDAVEQVFMFRDGELDRVLDEPDSAEAARMRTYDYQAVLGRVVPSATSGPPAPVVCWARSAVSPGLLQAGGRMRGSVVSPGTAVGPARVGRSASQADVRYGDVLVVATAASSWRVYLPLVAAVVCEGGAYLSELAFHCRELGVPCLTGVTGATARLPEGRTVRVDGLAGAVELG